MTSSVSSPSVEPAAAAPAAPAPSPQAVEDFPALARAARTFAHEQPLRSWLQVVPTLVLAVACQVALLLPLPLWTGPAVGTLFGLLLIRIFIFYHDVLHRALFRDSRLGRGLILPFSLYFVYPPWVWRDRHQDHHRRNCQLDDRSIGGQVPLYSTTAWAGVGPGERKVYRVVRSWLGLVLGYIPFFLVPVYRSSVTDPGIGRTAILWPIVQIGVAVGLALTVGPWAAWWGFVYPIWMATILGAVLFFVQHNAPSVTFKMPGEWDYGYAALHSSTYLQLPRWQHWFTGNIGYHHVHHVNDRIPFYRLPEVMAALPELQDPPRTDLGLRELGTCLKLQLWDPERHALVPLNEA